MRRGMGYTVRCTESISRCEVMTGVVSWKERRGSGRMREVKKVTAAAATAAANIPVPAMEQLAR